MTTQGKDRYHHYTRWERGEAHPLRITPRDLDYLYALFLHGPLPANMLHAIVAPTVKQQRTTDRLKLLERNPNALVDRPPQQRHAYNANYRHLTYAISRKGMQALRDFDRLTPQTIEWYRRITANRKHYQHETMAAYLTGSIDLGARHDRSLRFIPWHDILARPRCPESTRYADNPFEMPYTLDGKRQTLIPDGLFGIEYVTRGEYAFFALEADRHTEPIESNDLRRSSYVRKLHAYRQVIRDSVYQKHFGIPNLQVLNVTVSDLHLGNIMAHLQRLAATGGKIAGTRPFLFKSVSSLNPYVNKPPATAHVLSAPWQRVGLEEVYINR
jgi:hypothetical protein